MTLAAIDDMDALPVSPSLLGESPLWHPTEAALYWCDIAGRCLNRWRDGRHEAWQFDSEPACCAPLLSGGLLLALRSGLWRFDPADGACTRLAEPPYDPAVQRFNDGKTDPQGRFWVSTIHEPRDRPAANLYRFDDDGLLRAQAGGVTVGNGLAWSADGATLYWADTTAHTVYAFDFDAAEGQIARRRVFATFALKRPDQDLATYGGRPDGAAVDSEGCYWVAMFEGARVLRLSPAGELLQELPLPVRCPTMPCFGGADLRTLYITSSRDKRSAAELAREPLAGRVLVTRVDVPGLPANCIAPGYL